MNDMCKPTTDSTAKSATRTFVVYLGCKVCERCRILIWSFPKIGVPPSSSSISRWDFPWNHLAIGVHFWNPPYNEVFKAYVVGTWDAGGIEPRSLQQQNCSQRGYGYRLKVDPAEKKIKISWVNNDLFWICDILLYALLDSSTWVMSIFDGNPSWFWAVFTGFRFNDRGCRSFLILHDLPQANNIVEDLPFRVQANYPWFVMGG